MSDFKRVKNITISISFENKFAVVNVSDGSDSYSEELRNLPRIFTDKLIKNQFDFDALPFDFGISLFEYISNKKNNYGNNSFYQVPLHYKGLTNVTGYLLYQPKPNISLENSSISAWVLDKFHKNDASFIVWADLMISLLGYCSNEILSFVNLLEYIEITKNGPLLKGSLINTEEQNVYRLTKAPTLGQILNGVECYPVKVALSEYTPEDLKSTNTGVFLSNVTSFSTPENMPRLVELLTARHLNRLKPNLLPEGHQVLPVDKISQEQLDLEEKFINTPPAWRFMLNAS